MKEIVIELVGSMMLITLFVCVTLPLLYAEGSYQGYLSTVATMVKSQKKIDTFVEFTRLKTEQKRLETEHQEALRNAPKVASRAADQFDSEYLRYKLLKQQAVHLKEKMVDVNNAYLSPINSVISLAEKTGQAHHAVVQEATSVFESVARMEDV